MSLLVYALASRGAGRLRLAGVRGERLETVRVGSIDAIVGAVARPPAPTAHALRRYDRVVRALWARRPAVLPVRFATMMGDRAELELTLRVRQETLWRQLAVVRHRAQMTVRVAIGDRGPGIGDRGVGIEGPQRATRGPFRGRRYLEARARGARLDHVPEVAVVRAAVRPWVRAERAEVGTGLATVYHLVPRGASTRYRRGVARVVQSARLRLYVSGPWPAYAFAEVW